MLWQQEKVCRTHWKPRDTEHVDKRWERLLGSRHSAGSWWSIRTCGGRQAARRRRRLAKLGLPRPDGFVLGPIAASACPANCQISCLSCGWAVAVDVEQHQELRLGLEINRAKVTIKYSTVSKIFVLLLYQSEYSIN